MKDSGERELLSSSDIETLTTDTLVRAGLARPAAASVAAAIRGAEERGQRRLGLDLVPHMAEHLRSGRVSGRAQPRLTVTASSVLEVDAGAGFFCPAIDLALDPLAELAERSGVAALIVTNAYPVGSLATTVARLGSRGLSALALVQGLEPQANPNGTLSLQIVERARGLPTGIALPAALHGAGSGPDRAVPYEGPLGASFRLTHRIVAVQSSVWPSAASHPEVRLKKSGIAVPVVLLEKIVNA